MKTETALITGASSGIGMHLAHQFASHGYHIAMTAPVESELQSVAAEIRQEHGVNAHIVPANLEDPAAPQTIFDSLQTAGIEIDILANNAGQGSWGNWHEQSLEDDLTMLRVNNEAVLRLTRLFLAPMLQRGRGRILITASVAGFMPGPLHAVYSASKAFLLSWSEALATELEETPITITALCPGVTDTDFFEKEGTQNIRGRQTANVLAPQEVAAAGYEALMKGELFVVPGAINKAIVAARRILPVSTQAKLNQIHNEKTSPEHSTHFRGEKEHAAHY